MKRMIFALVALTAILVGCASPQQMAFDRKATAIDTSTKSVVLLTIDVSRQDDSRWQPEAKILGLSRNGGKEAEDRLTYPLTNDDDRFQVGNSNLVMVRMALEPGEYQLGQIWGMASAFPVHGYFSIPMTGSLKVAPKSVTYAGQIKAVMRPRKDGEFRAGPPTPILDQAISGMTRSTWDVEILDAYSKDIAFFEERFPAVKTVKVEKSLLPPFNREAVQKAWVEAQGPNYKGD